MDACRRGQLSPNQGAAPPLGGPPTGGGDSSRLVVCQALGRQVLRWDVHRASSSRTAGPRDQHESEPTHSDTAAAPHLQPAFLTRSHRSYSVEVAEVATQHPRMAEGGVPRNLRRRRARKATA